MKVSGLMLISLMLILSACQTGQIKVEKDDFKQSTVVRMTLSHISKDCSPGIFGSQYTSDTEYVREIKAKGIVPTSMYFKIKAGEDNDMLTEKAFIKIDDVTHEVPVTEIAGSVMTEINSGPTYGHFSQPGHVAQPGYVDYTKQHTQNQGGMTQLSSTRWKELTGKLQISEKMEAQILNCKSLMLRLYSGSKPITFILEEDKIKKIKEFLKTKPQTK